VIKNYREKFPEVFDGLNKYMRVKDLGIARVWNSENGIPWYMAPEVMCRQNNGAAVYYFAMGVIGYECMHSKRPYVGKTRKEIRDHILSK
jgi:serine/threonine protein kinase